MNTIRVALHSVDHHATVFLVGGMIVLVLLGFARIYTVETAQSNAQTALRKQQIAACLLRREGRANTNTHERIPLRAAFNYLASLGAATSAKQPDPAVRAATKAFEARFHRYAKQIKPLPNPVC